MKNIIITLIILITPLYVFAQSASNYCFSSSENYYLFHYNKNNKSEPVVLYINSKINNDKTKLIGNKKSPDSKTNNEMIFKNNKNKYIIIDSLKPKYIIYDGEKIAVKETDCFTFSASFDNYIDDSGKSISVYTKGKNYMEEKFKDSSFSPSFSCKHAESNLEKAICNNSEIAYLDNLFTSSMQCYKKVVANTYDNKEYYEKSIDNLINDFINYRNKAFKSNAQTFTEKELEQVRKAYILGLIFIPMTLEAQDGDIYMLDKKLFMSYYMLSMQGVTYTDKDAQKGFALKEVNNIIYKAHADEIMYYYTGVYDNMNNRLPHLFYYTVYLKEKYGFIDDAGNFKCE